MNLQTIRYRFSIFLKQFRIEDLKLLMKFLNEIVIEYKNSKSSRLFDLLSHQEADDNETFQLIYDNDFDDKYENKNKPNNIRTNMINQNDKLRRMKLLNAKRTLMKKAAENKINKVHIKQEEEEYTDSNQDQDISINNQKRQSTDHDKQLKHNKDIEADSFHNRHCIIDQIRQYDSKKNNNPYSNDSDINSDDQIDENEEQRQEAIQIPLNKYNQQNLLNEAKRLRLDLTNSRNSLNSRSNQSVEDESQKSQIKCAVCSDSASGTRYGVCVCEGCKEFFRRQRENPTNNKVLKCVHGTNNCDINVENRTQCRKCRLEKCIKLGMKLSGAKFPTNYSQVQSDSIHSEHNII